jgi:hypothetical protein
MPDRGEVETTIHQVLTLVRKAARDDYLGFPRVGDATIDTAVEKLVDLFYGSAVHRGVQ